jgi:hypothetical protein
LLADVWQILKHHRLHPLWEGDEYIFADVEGLKNDPYFQFLQTQLGGKLLPIDGSEEKWSVNKMTVTFDEDSDLNALEQLSAHFTILRHDFPLAELVPCGYSKATGLEVVRQALGLEVADTYAIGDSVNDLDMIRAAGTGIAMGNASEVAKEAADYVTSDIHEDGIAHALEKFGLI